MESINTDFNLPYRLVLASNSPRRKELLSGLGFPFEVKVMPDISEDYPKEMPSCDVAAFLSRQKAEAYRATMRSDELIITADTVVIVDSEILGKPIDKADAWRMLQLLSDKKHQVVTGVSLTTMKKQISFSVTTDVCFKKLKDKEIEYYIENYKPYDKAGAYGVQEWIGYVGVTHLSGSYFNVMGLPIQRIWEELQSF